MELKLSKDENREELLKPFNCTLMELKHAFLSLTTKQPVLLIVP